MLVLDRKINEGFWIEGNIFVKVLGVGRQRVKLGIDAPSDLKIVREELGSLPTDGMSEEGDSDPLNEQGQAGDPSGQRVGEGRAGTSTLPE